MMDKTAEALNRIAAAMERQNAIAAERAHREHMTRLFPAQDEHGRPLAWMFSTIDGRPVAQSWWSSSDDTVRDGPRNTIYLDTPEVRRLLD